MVSEVTMASVLIIMSYCPRGCKWAQKVEPAELAEFLIGRQSSDSCHIQSSRVEKWKTYTQTGKLS